MANSSASIRAIAAPKDTFYVGNLKGVGHVYQQTFIDTPNYFDRYDPR